MSSTSGLSVDAKEFVPTSYPAEVSTHKLSADAKEFVPSSRSAVVSTLSANAKEFVPSSQPADKGSNFEHSSGADLINHTVSSLVQSPEEFFEIAYPVIDIMKELIETSPEALHSITDELVNQSILVGHNQYIGARLCAFLHQHLPQDMASEFRSSLLNRCKKEFDRKHLLCEKVEDHRIIVSFTLFMGELMTQMTKNTGETLKLFLPKVLELLSCLLSIDSDETLRGFTHTLKLTGAILDKLDKPKVDELMQKIKLKSVDAKTSEYQKRLLLNIIELRAEKWRAADGGDQTPAGKTEVPISTNELVLEDSSGGATEADSKQEFYDSSEEELMNRCNEDDFEVIDDGEEQYVVPRDMDAEMEAAFECFMLDSSANFSANRR